MNPELRTIAIAVLLVGQVAVVVAASEEVRVGPEVQHDGEIHEWSSVTTQQSVDAAVLAHPWAVEALAVDLADAVGWLLPELAVAALGYSRHDDSDPLENETRRCVYEAVVDSPGTYVSQVASDCDVSTSTVRYHVRILAEEGLVETEKIRGKRRIFPSGEVEAGVETALNDDVMAAVLEVVGREEPASVSALADALDRSPSTVSYHLSRLEESGAIEREREGERVIVSLTTATRTRLDDDAEAGG